MKLGDLVQLNSGGPVMTVNGFGISEVIVVWCDKIGAFHRATVNHKAVRPYTKSEEDK